jgi:hypothetical protein
MSDIPESIALHLETQGYKINRTVIDNTTSPHPQRIYHMVITKPPNINYIHLTLDGAELMVNHFFGIRFSNDQFFCFLDLTNPDSIQILDDIMVKYIG